MKKIMAAFFAVALVFTAKAECTWDWWMESAGEDISGCALGIATANREVTGAQVALCATIADKVKAGAQVTLGYAQATTVRNGVQSAFITKADRAALQFGLLCFNKGGFLPCFVFFNFDKTMFGGEK